MKNNVSVLVSVIVPVYNAARWVERCVSSLMRQTHPEVEYIFVDDCGTDDSIDIIRSTASRYPARRGNVRIVRNDCNIGAGLSRLHGVHEARGRYVTFVDADDWIDPRMLEGMTEVAEAQGADMVYCAITEHCLDGGSRVLSSRNYETESDMVTDLCSGLCLNLVLWSKLIRRSLLADHDLTWPSTNCHEDIVTSFQLWLMSFGKCHYIDRAYYHYNRHEQSLSQPASIAQKELYLLEHESACARMTEFLRRMGKLRAYGTTILWKRLSVWDHWSECGFDGRSLSPRMKWLGASICWAVLLGELSWRFKLGFLWRQLTRILV